MRLVDVADEELCTGPGVDKAGSTIIDFLHEEEPTMRPGSASGDGARVCSQTMRVCLDRQSGKPLRGEGIVPECAGARLEPGVLRAERSGSALELLPYPCRLLTESA